jgi:hypothetical protein
MRMLVFCNTEYLRLSTSIVAFVILHLLLLRFLSLLLGLLPLLPNTYISCITPRPSQLRIRVLISLRHLTLLHLRHTKLDASTCLNRHSPIDTKTTDDVLFVLGGFDIGFLGVEGLVLAGFAGEENQAGFVGLEAGDVQGEGFFGGGAAAGVDGDADCGRELAGDAGFLVGVLVLSCCALEV